MRSKVYTVGRADDCDIIIDDPSNITSGKHAVFRIDKNGNYTITDCSTNGTYVNGIKIEPNVEVPIRRTDKISFAHMVYFNWDLIPNYKKKTLILVLSLVTGIIVLSAIAFVVLKCQEHSNYDSGYNWGNQQIESPKNESPTQMRDSTTVKDTLTNTKVTPPAIAVPPSLVTPPSPVTPRSSVTPPSTQEKLRKINQGVKMRKQKSATPNKDSAKTKQTSENKEQPSDTTQHTSDKKKVTNPLI